MPYIPSNQREQLKTRPAITSGELNYLFCQHLKRYIEGHPRISYDALQQCIHTLDRVYDALRYREFGHVGNLTELEANLTKTIKEYAKNWPHLSTHEINQAQGAVRCAQLEFYRKVVAPYEDLKCATNGDVFT